MTAFLGDVIRLRLNNPRRQPQPVDLVTNDLAEQLPGKRLRVAMKKTVRQGAR